MQVELSRSSIVSFLCLLCVHERLHGRGLTCEWSSIASPLLMGALPVQPVSQKAKKTLGQSFFRLAQPGTYAPPQDKLICDRNSACAVAYA